MAKVALFTGPLHINAARGVGAAQLMQWWQPYLKCLWGFPPPIVESAPRTTSPSSEMASSSLGPCVLLSSSSDYPSSSDTNWAGDAVMGLQLAKAHHLIPGSLNPHSWPNTWFRVLCPHNSPSKLLFFAPIRGEKMEF